MKAESAIFVGVQRPITLFGIAPQLFALTITGAALVFGVFIAIDLISLALIGAVISFVGIWLFLFRATRRDSHFANFIFVTPRFWRGAKRRHLVTGNPKE